MHLSAPSFVHPIGRNALFAALMIAIVATGYESMSHGHAPVAPGWHDAAPHGRSGHDDGRTPCSICGVAHETSAGLLACVEVMHSQRVFAHAVRGVDAYSLGVHQREHSPRAPPCDRSC
jgi:hypothetical protein